MSERSKRTWDVRASFLARSTQNLIRSVVESINDAPNPDQNLISLSIGDPTKYGNLGPPKQALQAVADSIDAKCIAGYGPMEGQYAAREAVAEYSASQGRIEPEDVILTNGCAQALDVIITAIADAGQNILIPRPGFQFYVTLAKGFGIKMKYYDLLPDQQWQVDLEHLESQIDNATAAVIVNNPLNPCGSVYSRKHLLEILNVASRNCVPIISDEIYEHLVFSDQTFISISSLSKDVPVITCSGIGKRFLVPGWRMGWLIIHDRQNILRKEIRQGVRNLASRLLGPNTLIQRALPMILRNTPQGFFQETIFFIESQAKIAYMELRRTPGLYPTMPQGTFYMVVKINIEQFQDIQDDVEFAERLLCEQSVSCLPGKCFAAPNYVRMTLSLPEDKLREALLRIAVFCRQHNRKI